MKIGFRVPNLEKKIKAKTTGAFKRKVKSTVNPLYSKKGMGIINNPKKALYNKIYNKVTIDSLKVIDNSNQRDIVERDDFRIDKKDAEKYINDNFKKYIDISLKEHSQIFVLMSAANKLSNGDFETDDDIIEYIGTSCKNIKINSKILPLIFKIGGAILILVLAFLIIFK